MQEFTSPSRSLSSLYLVILIGLSSNVNFIIHIDDLAHKEFLLWLAPIAKFLPISFDKLLHFDRILFTNCYSISLNQSGTFPQFTIADHLCNTVNRSVMTIIDTGVCTNYLKPAINLLLIDLLFTMKIIERRSLQGNHLNLT
jgi:hypothetical protein